MFAIIFVVGIFLSRYLVDLLHQFNASADLLIEKLSHKADGKTEVAMLDEFNRTTLDVIAKVRQLNQSIQRFLEYYNT